MTAGLLQVLEGLDVRGEAQPDGSLHIYSDRAQLIGDVLGCFGFPAEIRSGRIVLASPTTPARSKILCSALRPEAILFDMDGVMVDVSGSYRQAILDTLRVYGVELGPEDIGRAKRAGHCNNDWELTHRLLKGAVSLGEVTETFENLYQGTPDRPGLRSHEKLLVSPEWLHTLSRRLPLAVVTGRPRADCVRLLEEHHLSEAFSVLVCMGDAQAKPHPAPTRLALSRLGVERAWMIGDTVDDIRSAHAAEVIPLGILAPGEDVASGRAALLSAGAARILESLSELENLLP